MSAVTYPQPPEILRPSSAPRWWHCEFSAALEALFPEDEESQDAREGTAGHFYPSEHQSGRTVTPGTLAPNGYPIDADMIRYAQDYLTSVVTGLQELYALDPATIFGVETKLAARALIHPANEGTPDAFALARAARRLKIWDYKYGHLSVNVEWNGQLIDYFACIVETYGLSRREIDAIDVEMVIAQPRAHHRDGPLRTWRMSGAALMKHVEAMAEAASRAMRPGARARTGEWCRDCKGRHACEAYTERAGHAEEVAKQAIPLNISPDAMARELQRIKRAGKVLEARAVSLEQQIIAQTRAGRPVSGWTLGRVNSQERWNVPADAVAAVGDIHGIDLRAPEPVISVSAARAKFKAAGKPFDDLAPLAYQPTGAPKLLPVDPADAMKAFGDPSKGT